MTIKRTKSRETSTVKSPLKDSSIKKTKNQIPSVLLEKVRGGVLRDETKTAAWETTD